MSIRDKQATLGELLTVGATYELTCSIPFTYVPRTFEGNVKIAVIDIVPFNLMQFETQIGTMHTIITLTFESVKQGTKVMYSSEYLGALHQLVQSQTHSMSKVKMAELKRFKREVESVR